MAERGIFIPRTRLDLVYIFKRRTFNVSDSTDELMRVLGLDEEEKFSISSQFRKVTEDLRKSKKSPEFLSTDKWWSNEIPCQPCQQNDPTKITVGANAPKAFRKTILSLCLSQQRKRLESVLDCIQTVAKTEETSPSLSYH